MLRRACNQSFNQITVDGDTSTNDTVVGLASGKAGGINISDDISDEGLRLQSALTALCQGLAKMIAWDGEGANVLLAVAVEGAATEEDARIIAKSVASSSLTKAGE